MDKIIHREEQVGMLLYMQLLGIRVLSTLTFRKVSTFEEKRIKIEKKYFEKSKIL